MPPNTPPGGNVPPPYPPYDPKTQWRVYREQQKAAWRAQRDAWKAQRQAQQYAWKANRVAAFGPRVPSIVGPIILIAVGVIALLMLSGHIDAGQFWSWYGHWWPLLFIGAGLALLGEWALDLRRETPVRRGGNFVGILIFLAIVGICASGWNHAEPWFHWNGDGDEFFNAFGLPEHDMDQQTLSQQLPANAAIQIENPRGDVSITAGDGSAITVQAHEVAYASSEAEAKKVFDAVAAHLTASGSSVLVQTESNSSGRVNLTITVPKTAKVTVNASRGDVTAASLGVGITVTARGDVQLNSIAGPVEAHFPHGHHDFSAHDIQGDVSVDGDLSNITLSEIKGKVTQSGEILLGGAHMESIHGPVHMHTSVTDVDLAELPGDLTLDSDDLRVNEAKGQVRVVTHSKDIDLNQVYGDSYVETRNGRITVEPAGVYSVDAKNNKGDVEVTLPPNASATVNAHTHNGDIVSDYAIPSTSGENKLATFTIGSGASRIVLSASNGDVRIKKGPGFPSAPSPAAPNQPKVPMSNVPPYHSVPDLTKAPHLKEPKVPPAPPVKQ
jgi:DUF4097 and DUF4098 domain-containing protein YvlB